MSDRVVTKQIRWKGNQRRHEGHNRAGVVEGTNVWAVQHIETKLFFYYAYLTKKEAEATIETMEEKGGLHHLETNFKAFPGAVVIKRQGQKDKANG